MLWWYVQCIFWSRHGCGCALRSRFPQFFVFAYIVLELQVLASSAQVYVSQVEVRWFSFVPSQKSAKPSILSQLFGTFWRHFFSTPHSRGGRPDPSQPFGPTILPKPDRSSSKHATYLTSSLPYLQRPFPLQIFKVTAIMWILPLLGYVGVVLGFGFLTLAIGTSLVALRASLPVASGGL